MDEAQVRQLVRQAIARHMGGPEASSPVTRPVAPAAVAPSPVLPGPVASASGLAFARFQLVRPAGETECLIEPTVTCNHCGHCQCYGH
jgi:hypothetical protein